LGLIEGLQGGHSAHVCVYAKHLYLRSGLSWSVVLPGCFFPKRVSQWVFRAI
jgi:hypothetical protein